MRFYFFINGYQTPTENIAVIANMVQQLNDSQIPEVISWSRWFKTIRIYNGGSSAILTQLFKRISELKVGSIQTVMYDNYEVIQGFGILLSKHEYEVKNAQNEEIKMLHKILHTFEPNEGYEN